MNILVLKGCIEWRLIFFLFILSYESYHRTCVIGVLFTVDHFSSSSSSSDREAGGSKSNVEIFYS